MRHSGHKYEDRKRTGQKIKPTRGGFFLTTVLRVCAMFILAARVLKKKKSELGDAFYKEEKTMLSLSFKGIFRRKQVSKKGQKTVSQKPRS